MNFFPFITRLQQIPATCSVELILGRQVTPVTVIPGSKREGPTITCENLTPDRVYPTCKLGGGCLPLYHDARFATQRALLDGRPIEFIPNTTDDMPCHPITLRPIGVGSDMHPERYDTYRG